MNRIDRLTAILIQLQTKSWITAAEIAGRHEISVRTVYRDIRALGEAGIPIGSEAGRGYFIVEGYHLPPVMFTREEAGAMLIAGKLIDKLTDKSLQAAYNAAVDKIRSVLPSSYKDTLEGLNKQVRVYYSRQTGGEGYPDNFLSDIQKALSENKCISLDYHAGYNQEKTTARIVDPYGLVFYGNAWHLIGFCKLRNEMRDFRLDRMLNLKVTGECASPKKGEELKAYLDDLWQMADLYEAKVWFHKSILSYLNSSKYYFGYIDEVRDKEGSIMSFAVTDYRYLANWLLSWGGLCKVISPEDLANEVVTSVKELARVYLK